MDSHKPADWKPRVEDAALLTGRGRFTDDVHAPNEAIACFVRSPHALATLRSIDTAAARALPGVLGVFTHEELAAFGAKTISHPVPVPGLIVPPRPALAEGQVVHVGQPVVMVVAETLAIAQDAAELVEIDYAPLAPVVTLDDAVAAGTVAVDWPGPHPEPAKNAEAVNRVFEQAAHTVSVSVVNQRIVVASMETRGGTASYDAANDRWLLRAPSQGVRMLRDQLAASLGLTTEQLRLVTDDVGGAFGMKTAAYPEYVAMLVAARQIGRPVHWMSTRAESFLSDNQARDTITKADLALDAEGRFLALRVAAVAAVGAFLSSHGASIATGNFARCFPGMYLIPHIDVRVKCVFTNTVQLGPYRGAGRPEANYALERLVDAAAEATGIDRIELRRRNLLSRAQIPYATAVGTRYDSGDFEAVLDKALAAADVAGFAARRAKAERAGKKRGLGISCFLEHAGGMPGDETAIVFPGDNTLVVRLAMHGSGQGHPTLYRRLAAERLGIDDARISTRQGDSDFGLVGMAAVASRSTTTAGSALVKTVELVLEKGKRIAGQLLEAAEADIDYAAGFFSVAGTDRRIGLFEVARRAGEIGETLDTKGRAEVPQTFPNGCHVAEVEIDPDTGVVELLAYIAIDDCGVILDPVMVEGQVQGGIAQGVGQALCEDAVYDRDGQLLAGSFMDYAMPRADMLPNFTSIAHPVPCTTNPLGVKGTGEAGTTGALAAIMNAVSDALPGTHIDMPATPEKIWRACSQHP
jgi:carbon-monoxide dehydrogenase large subunit